MIEWVPKQKKEDGKRWFAVVDETNTTEETGQSGWVGMEEIQAEDMTQSPSDLAGIQGEANKDYSDVTRLDFGKLAMLLMKQKSWKKN